MALRSLATLKQAMNSIDDILFNRFSELEPMDFGREFTTMLRQILAKSPRERWSIQSLVYDLWKEYFLESMLTTHSTPPPPKKKKKKRRADFRNYFLFPFSTNNRNHHI